MLWKCVKYPKRKAKLQSSERTLKLFLLFKNQTVTVLHILLWIGRSFRKQILQQFEVDTETTLVPFCLFYFQTVLGAGRKQIQRLRNFALPSLLRTSSSVCAEKKKIVFLLESVSSREFKFSSHGFHGPHSFALSVLPQRTITFPLPSPSVTDQCLFSEKVLRFFLRNCIFKEIISKIHTSAFLN